MPPDPTVNGGPPAQTPPGNPLLSGETSAGPPPLSEMQLANVRLLAREGNREICIRQVIGIPARTWRELKAVDDSPLMEALEAGRAEGAGLVICFMRERMSKNSMEAAKWLGEHVYGITKPAAGEGVNRTTHVLVLPAPMSEEEWARVQRGRVIDVEPLKVTHAKR